MDTGSYLRPHDISFCLQTMTTSSVAAFRVGSPGPDEAVRVLFVEGGAPYSPPSSGAPMPDLRISIAPAPSERLVQLAAQTSAY